MIKNLFRADPRVYLTYIYIRYIGSEKALNIDVFFFARQRKF